MTSEEISKEMTSEEIKKLIRKKGRCSITLGDRKLTDKELYIWRKGYFDGIADGLGYSIARTKEMFDTNVKGEEK